MLVERKLHPKEVSLLDNDRQSRRRTPGSTYRLQLHQGFGFREASAVLPYLEQLGITDCYTSPMFKARPGSQHGYDITDHHMLNPELGTEEDYEQFVKALKKHGMGHLLDFVPNHMGIDPENNPWWRDVLQNGPDSPFARYFDINWDPIKPELKNKVLLPILSDQYGVVLERGDLKLVFDRGDVLLQYGEQHLPINALQKPDVLKQGLGAYNGKPGHSETFDALHELLEKQFYRLAYWKTASHEINYRRFFDINQLAGLRIEQPEVFQNTHRRLFELIDAGKVTGLRLDHPDGLYDPAVYFRRLQDTAPVYVVTEKILSGEEPPRKAWAVDGTSGYDFLKSVNLLFVDAQNGQTLKEIYEGFTGRPADFSEIVYRSKKLIMSTSLASELNVLAHRLNQISEKNRRSRDFTLESLRDALKEVVACFAVYRTYINGPAVSPSDALVITKAVAEAKRLNPATEASIFDFVREILIPARVPGMAEADYQERLDFAMKFQQYTAPVQAKGFEDTAFYRYNVLLSLNEVGGEPSHFGISITDFHQANQERRRDWPGSLSATATHDTKRGEDSRMRLDVLSELPHEWQEAVLTWARINRTHKTVSEERVMPDADDEYHFYQALLGAWIPEATDQDVISLRSRLTEYMMKAIREAKRHTSWIRPNEEYEQAMRDFVEHTLTNDKGAIFLSAFKPFAARIAAAGLVNSLAHLALKGASPGVPDFYQGTELWDWNLVDPDNRRSVDFETRQHLLNKLERQTDWEELLRHWPDGRIKLFMTSRVLAFRRSHRELFLQGSYLPLHVSGAQADHVVAFARELGEQKLIVVVPCLTARFSEDTHPWKNTQVELPLGWRLPTCRNLFTNESLSIPEASEVSQLAVSELFRMLPVAWVITN